jgi:catechol 2,3-dioxygenase-like lactoylglutathione lyase family enzyme
MAVQLVTTKHDEGVRGIDHIAYPTWRPAETVRFYRDVLGFPLVHSITAKGWGNHGHPDFVHFFFDIGAGGRIAFFYYFGVDEYEDPNITRLIQTARHTAILVDTDEELTYYQRRIESAGEVLRYRISHELIESIYTVDPNGYHIEFCRQLRPVMEHDAVDAEITLAALGEVAGQPEPTLEKLLERKAALIADRFAAVRA